MLGNEANGNCSILISEFYCYSEKYLATTVSFMYTSPTTT